MGVEETSHKSMATTTTTENQQIENNNNNIPGDVEEGEIIDDVQQQTNNKKNNTISHPLEYSWTFWFDSPAAKAKAKPDEWGTSNCSIYTFSTVEHFWSLYNNINHPSKLAVGSDFYCFKSNIEPKWEDPICTNGGKWTVSYQRGKSDTSWLYTLLAMIGEQFDHGDEICGAVVNVRAKQDKISLWTKDAANEAAQMSIGRQWKKFLDYNDNIGFIFHDDAQKLDRAAKNRYLC
ncbi:hypothetical protein RND81_07G159000 [Saponaria officinalis]|uniref:eIF-4F 25 kDa subunit n=1 Tax=Saponaria officinalis TaxID=3572 RepID=A0AAW1JNW3_SAPOF